MKKISTLSFTVPVMLIAILCIVSAFNSPSPGNQHVCQVFNDTVVVKKIHQQYSKDIIALDPNPNRGMLHVKNTSTDINEVQFYVFDLEGVMIENIKLTRNERKKISGLNKGTYMYEVFNEDESIERGKIIVE